MLTKFKRLTALGMAGVLTQTDAEQNNVSLNVTNNQNVDVVLTKGNTTMNLTNFKADLLSALSKQGINTSKVNISAIETAQTDMQNSFSWNRDVSSSIGSISTSSNSVSMAGNSSLAGKNCLYAFPTETGHIILQKASGEYLPQYSFGKPTLWNDAYFDSLVRSYPGQHFKKKELQTVFSVVSLFSGAGLLDYAFKDPQFRFVYGVDFDEDACATYRKNIGEHIVCKDIRNVSSKEVPDCDVIIGGPCCQAYSNANRTNINTKKSEQKRLLIEDFVRIVKEKTPKIFVIENVPQMLTKDNGKYIKKIYDNLSEYEITSTVVSDAAVGGYTLRKRAIIIGSKIGKIELPSHEVHTLHTVNEALSKVDDTWFNQSDVTLPRENTKLCMSYVPQGGNWKNIPESIHKFGPSTQSNAYRRLSLTGLSPTLTNWRKCILTHPTKNRILTVSEAAALMGLDKKFHVLGRTLNSKQQQIGNGVTQAIGRFVKKHILNALNKNL